MFEPKDYVPSVKTEKNTVNSNFSDFVQNLSFCKIYKGDTKLDQRSSGRHLTYNAQILVRPSFKKVWLKMKFTPFLHEFHPFFLTPFLNESHPFFRWNSPLFEYEFHPFSTWISPLFITTFMIEYHPLYEIHYFIKDNSRRCIGTISIPF